MSILSDFLTVASAFHVIEVIQFLVIAGAVIWAFKTFVMRS
jgi:hypothetical protein